MHTAFYFSSYISLAFVMVFSDEAWLEKSQFLKLYMYKQDLALNNTHIGLIYHKTIKSISF